ncbi:MAG: hypothetical protein JW757_00855 [Anaerolineales bacterium]|nr:hypothetical protein [Anaerolineales bacterium]
MKKQIRWIILFTLISLFVLATGITASADAPAKGEVIAIDIAGHTVTLDTKTGPVVITLPAEFEITSLAVGDVLMAKGIWVSQTELTADWVKVLTAQDDEPEDEGEDEGEDQGEEMEENEFNSAFCSGEKQTFHPLAYKLAEKFGESTDVTAEQIQTWYCEQNSIGAIMLALMTEKMNGTPAEDTLAERNSGKPWGKIWQEMGLIGKDKDGMPPGLLKKQDGKIPPGQLKKTPTP